LATLPFGSLSGDVLAVSVEGGFGVLQGLSHGGGITAGNGLADGFEGLDDGGAVVGGEFGGVGDLVELALEVVEGELLAVEFGFAFLVFVVAAFLGEVLLQVLLELVEVLGNLVEGGFAVGVLQGVLVALQLVVQGLGGVGVEVGLVLGKLGVEVLGAVLDLAAFAFEAAFAIASFGFAAATGFFGGSLAAFSFQSFSPLAFELGGGVFGATAHDGFS
jgi:hypothetical protein